MTGLKLKTSGKKMEEFCYFLILLSVVCFIYDFICGPQVEVYKLFGSTITPFMHDTYEHVSIIYIATSIFFSGCALLINISEMIRLDK